LVLRRTGVVGHTWEAMNHTVRRSLFLWLPVLFWLAVIAHFSGQPFSKQDLAPVLQRYPRLVQAVTALPEVQFRYAGSVLNNRRDPVRFLQFILRKAAHLFLYGMYGLSLMRALAGSGLIGARGFGLAAILVVLVAMLDEHNQARIAGRSGRPEDVALDFAGFLLFCSVIWGCALGRQCWRSAARRAPRRSLGAAPYTARARPPTDVIPRAIASRSAAARVFICRAFLLAIFHHAPFLLGFQATSAPGLRLYPEPFPAAASSPLVRRRAWCAVWCAFRCA
jgi:VanZ family protein